MWDFHRPFTSLFHLGFTHSYPELSSYVYATFGDSDPAISNDVLEGWLDTYLMIFKGQTYSVNTAIEE